MRKFMPKNNYTKVEEALAEGLRKMKVHDLLEEADNVKAGKGKKTEKQAENALLVALNLDLTHLSKHGSDPYKKLGLNKAEISKYLEHPEDLTNSDWDKIKKLKEDLENLKTEMLKTQKASDEEIIKKQVKEQKNKRFNVKDNWLPLQ